MSPSVGKGQEEKASGYSVGIIPTEGRGRVERQGRESRNRACWGMVRDTQERPSNLAGIVPHSRPGQAREGAWEHPRNSTGVVPHSRQRWGMGCRSFPYRTTEVPLYLLFHRAGLQLQQAWGVGQ